MRRPDAGPWRGLSPLESASSTGTLAANLEQRLGDEAGASVGAFIPTPKADGDDPDDDDDPLAKLRGDLRSAKGRAVLVESMATAWGEGPGAAPHGDWRQHRFGADPPEVLEALRTSVSLDVLSCCGVPGALVTSATSTGAREAWRRFLFGSVAPLAKIVTEELAAKLSPEIGMDFEELRASDLAGRARAYKQLTEAGMDAGAAARIAGFDG